MKPLRGEPWCWNHHPARAKARSEARARGGEHRHRSTAAPSTPATTQLAPVPFSFTFTRRSDIGDAVLRLAQAIADGTLDPRRGRLLIDGCRTALAAYEGNPNAGVDDDIPPPGCREMTDSELRYVVEHEGRLPPGVRMPGPLRPWWVEGPIWTPPGAEAPAPADPDMAPSDDDSEEEKS
jgi:hypothetical protein